MSKKTPQVENGYFNIANQIFDEWGRINLSPYQWAVLHHIIRFTYGFHVKENKISISHIATGTGLPRQNVLRALKELIAKNIVVRRDYKCAYNKDSSSWKIPLRGISVVSRDYKSSVETTKNAAKGDSVATTSVVSRDYNLSSVESPNKDIKIIKDNKRPINKAIEKRETAGRHNSKTIDEVWKFYTDAAKTNERLLPARIAQITARLKTFTPKDIQQAIIKCFNDPFHTGKKEGSDWVANADYVFKSDIVIDKLLNLPKPKVDYSEGMPISEWKNSPNYIPERTE